MRDVAVRRRRRARRTGRLQPPPSSARNARSASTAVCASRRRWHASRSRVASSSARHSTASAPCPTCGSITVGSSTLGRRARRARAGRAPRPRPRSRRSRAAFSSRVGDVAAQLGEREVGAQRPRAARAAAPNRCRSRAPAGARRASSRRARRAGRPAPGTAASTSPRAMADAGRSFAECTAMSARPSSTACCTSFTNTPVPPIAWIGVSVRVSPVVVTITSSASPPSSVDHALGLPAGERAAARRDAERWHQASGSASRQREQLGQRVGVEIAARGAGGVLDADGRLVQQLVDDAARQRVERFPRFRRSRSPSRRASRSSSREADLLGARAQRGDERRDFARGPLERGSGRAPRR